MPDNFTGQRNPVVGYSDNRPQKVPSNSRFRETSRYGRSRDVSRDSYSRDASKKITQEVPRETVVKIMFSRIELKI